MDINKNCPAGLLGNPKIKRHYSNSVSSQRARILKHFDQRPRLSTIQAREQLGILHPCGRVKELRAKGYCIETYWAKEVDANGVLHRIGLYVYKGKQEAPYEQ